eukprot:1366593-Amorphochlora_amoeboformis.AAC.1
MYNSLDSARQVQLCASRYLQLLELASTRSRACQALEVAGYNPMSFLFAMVYSSGLNNPSLF